MQLPRKNCAPWNLRETSGLCPRAPGQTLRPPPAPPFRTGPSEKMLGAQVKVDPLKDSIVQTLPNPLEATRLSHPLGKHYLRHNRHAIHDRIWTNTQATASLLLRGCGRAGKSDLTCPKGRDSVGAFSKAGPAATKNS